MVFSQHLSRLMNISFAGSLLARSTRQLARLSLVSSVPLHAELPLSLLLLVLALVQLLLGG